jgi:hypothetical protein
MANQEKDPITQLNHALDKALALFTVRCPVFLVRIHELISNLFQSANTLSTHAQVRSHGHQLNTLVRDVKVMLTVSLIFSLGR